MTMYELNNAFINTETTVENVYYLLETLKQSLAVAKADGATVPAGVVERVVTEAVQKLEPLVKGAKQ